eukprot:12964151-Ditylum_brightwellii.AAC.1
MPTMANTILIAYKIMTAKTQKCQSSQKVVRDVDWVVFNQDPPPDPLGSYHGTIIMRSPRPPGSYH